MPTVSSTLKMFDAMSSPLKNITNALNIMVSTMQKMQEATNKDVNVDKMLIAAKGQIASAEAQIQQAIDKANESQQRFNRSVQEGETQIRQAIDKANESQQRFNRSVKGAKSETRQLLSTIERIATAYLSFQGIQRTIGAADTFVSTQARLNLIVDEGQTVDQLQNNIFAAAERARGDFVAMASSASKLGLLAGDAFSNTDEIVAFTETMQKAFKVSGASIMEQQAGMYQLTQAMAAGRLQGDEFRSIMENAPMLADAIAKFTGKSKGELKEMSSEGLITADIIKAALFMAADDINKKFESLPKTFGDVWQQIKNNAFRAFEPVFQRLNEWLNSTQGAAMIQSMNYALQYTAIAADALVSSLMWMGSVIQSNWGIIEPILVAIGSAFALWALTQIPLLISKLWLMVQPILAQAAAWAMANLPLLLIGALIGLIIGLLIKMGVITDKVVGFISGIFSALFALIYNIIADIWNGFAGFAEFFANVFNHPVYSAKKLFADFVISTLNIIKKVAEAIDWVFGSNLAGGITKLQDKMMDWVGEMPEGYKVLDRMEKKSIGDSFKNGYEKGVNFVNGISDALNGFNMGAIGDLFSGNFDIANINKVNEVGKIRDTVDISSEDLKTMRELAEMKSIQNFVTLTPTVSVQTGPIQNGYDVDTIVARIETVLTEQIASSAKGVYNV